MRQILHPISPPRAPNYLTTDSKQVITNYAEALHRDGKMAEAVRISNE
jgi:hypothetical protein